MPLEQQSSIALEVKQLSDTGEFTGIASVSGNVDLGNDIVQPGAFTKTIAERGNKVRLMDNHKVRIGVATVTEVPEGLSAAGKINLEKQSGREAFSDLKFYRDHGLPMGMSIGYLPVKADYDAKGHRLLHEVKLYEVTVTELPMNERASVLNVKSVVDLIKKAKSSREKKDGFSAELAEAQLQASAGLMIGALHSTLSSLVWDTSMGRDEKASVAESHINQFSEAFLAYLPAYLDYLTESYGDLKSAQAQMETKSGRTISAATKMTLSTAHEHMKSATDLIYPLLESDADAESDDYGTTSKEKAGIEAKSEPVVDHSAIESKLDEALARLAA